MNILNPICEASFLLSNSFSQKLYDEVAKDLPIYDYHNHLSAKDIVLDRKFTDITELWLDGDHYKWRAMRANGIDEKYITGSADARDKFQRWSLTVPATIRNPLYHWTHLELKKAFGITTILNGNSANQIYDETKSLLQEEDYSVRNLLRKFNVSTLCTTEDPTDSLEWHIQLKSSSFEIKVLTAFRPDKAINVCNAENFQKYLIELEKCTNSSIGSYQSFVDALKTRHDYFHFHGCRLADHGLEFPFPVLEPTKAQLEHIFQQLMLKKMPDIQMQIEFKSALLLEFAQWNFEKGWVQQFHVGALRDVNTRAVRIIGQACGFDSIADFSYAETMGIFFNRLEERQMLTKTIVYNLNPTDNEVIASMVGNFQDGITPGKMQFGAAWWFSDQKKGIQDHLNCLSNYGLLSQFVGMVTDSRSFLSFSRHEYFRRILCDLIGSDIQNKEIPNDYELVSELISNICYGNAKKYFNT